LVSDSDLTLILIISRRHLSVASCILFGNIWDAESINSVLPEQNLINYGYLYIKTSKAIKPSHVIHHFEYFLFIKMTIIDNI